MLEVSLGRLDGRTVLAFLKAFFQVVDFSDATDWPQDDSSSQIMSLVTVVSWTVG